jgi:hypothetical protein
MAKAKSWMNHTFLYASRLQLIKFIFFSILEYWSSLFILSKVVIVKIIILLWNGSHLASGGAKVTWDKIWLLKEERGFNVKNLETWNQSTMVKHLWIICTRPIHSIWSSTIHFYLLRGRSI